MEEQKIEIDEDTVTINNNKNNILKQHYNVGLIKTRPT